MEPLWILSQMLEPAIFTLIVTAVLVTFGSAFRALNYSKEVEKNRLLSETIIIITLNRSRALMLPVSMSFFLITMFYFFSTVSLLLATTIPLAFSSSIYLCLFPYSYKLKSQLELTYPSVYRVFSKWPILHRSLLFSLCFGMVFTWIVSGNWILYNLIGICGCVTVVTHVRLPNVKICVMLLMCLFVCDIFWVFYSERFFGANVMESVATRKPSNPLHTIVNRLNLPGLQLIKKDLDLPGLLKFPENLFSGVPNDKNLGYIILGLGDMALPGMLLALILCFDHRKSQNTVSLLDLASSKDKKYIWYAISGYAIGLVAAMAAAILTHSSQPALLYLVPSTLGPVIVVSWMRRELKELWDWKASFPDIKGKTDASKE